MNDKILVVDDEEALRETLVYNLEHQGYEVVSAGDGIAALASARTHYPDMIILDLMLPGMDGLEVCRVLRKEMNTPILMLTARHDEIDRVVGLEVGADDYLTKPFSMRELLARVKAMLRRVRLMMEENIPEPISSTLLISSGNMQIDPERRELRINDQLIPLKPKEYELLVFFTRNMGRAINRETILEQVWGWDYIGESRTVDVHIRWLREKIEQDPTHPVRLITVRGAGYLFEG